MDGRLELARQQLNGKQVNYETGFKTFLNALDYPAVFLMAHQDHPYMENQMALIKATPKPMRIHHG
jgi:hypothetical protein